MSRQIGDRHRRLRYDGTSVSNGDIEIGEVENAVFEGSYLGLEASSAVMMVMGRTYKRVEEGLRSGF